jgi:hypothetical protein
MALATFFCGTAIEVRTMEWLKGRANLIVRRIGRWLDQSRVPAAAANIPDAVAKLRTGTRGVAVDFPQAWPVESTFRDDGFILHDPEHDVFWMVAHSLFPLSLACDEEHILAKDIRDSTRVAFSAYLRKRPADNANEASSRQFPITADPTWSPLVEMERKDLDGGPAMMIVHRLAHEFGNEVVAGRVLIPTTNGVTEIECRATDTTSGIRRALVTILVPEAQRPPEEAPAAMQQAFFDDPKHDARIRDALTRVRGALRWLVATDGGNLRVISAAQPQGRGAIFLDRARCSVIPPPRYLRLLAQTSLAQTVVPFARVTLSVVVGQPWSMDVFKLSGEDASADVDGLRMVAERSTRGWEAGGAVIVDAFESHSRPPREGHVEIRSLVGFRIGGQPLRSMQHWIRRIGAADDGSIWRLSITTDEEVAPARFEAELDAMAASWQPA